MNICMVALLLIIPFFLSGYGYMGDLPELGKTTKEPEKVSPQPKKFLKPNPLAIIAPRASTGYSVEKYSDYLSDIKQIEDLLKEIKAILEGEDNPKNRIQLFNAKAFLLGLYVDQFKEKYEDSPHKYYESYKQLVFIDDYLKQVGHSNADEAIIPINTVIGIISEAQNQGL